MKDYTSDIKDIRKDFPFFQSEVGKKILYLDNAATTLKPNTVIDAIPRYYVEYSANVNRAVYSMSQKVSMLYDDARDTIAKFIGANHSDEVIITSGTTASINHFSRSFAEAFLKEGDRILISEMEHHSNILPWQKIAKEYKCVLAYIPMDVNGELDLTNLDNLLSSPTKLVSLASISNTLGTINPINYITKKCKEKGVYTFIDAAQSIAHIKYELHKSNIDFFAFSGHKIFGPTGVGVFWGRKELLEKLPPFFLGGGMVYDVSLQDAIFSSIPSKFEAGTPPIEGVLGLAQAIQYIEQIGWDIIQGIDMQHKELGLDIFNNFSDYIQIFGKSKNKHPIFSFLVNQVHPHDIGTFFDASNIAVRTGHQCTQLIWKKMAVSSVTRISTSMYNLPSEWEIVQKKLTLLLEFFHVGKFS